MHAISFAKGVTDDHHDHDKDKNFLESAEFFLQRTHRTKIDYDGEKMAYGILVKNEEAYLYFEEFIRHNQVVYETCALLLLNEDDDALDEVHDIFSTEDKDAPFFDFLYACIGIIAAVGPGNSLRSHS